MATESTEEHGKFKTRTGSWHETQAAQERAASAIFSGSKQIAHAMRSWRSIDPALSK